MGFFMHAERNGNMQPGLPVGKGKAGSNIIHEKEGKAT